MHDRIVCSRTGFLDLKRCRPRRTGSVSPKDAIATGFGTTLQYSDFFDCHEVSEVCVCLQQYRVRRDAVFSNTVSKRKLLPPPLPRHNTQEGDIHLVYK